MQEEKLSGVDKYNEYVMTRLRTMWGVSPDEVEEKFGVKYKNYLLEQADPYLKKDLMIFKNENLHITAKGKFLGDGISSDLFFINLDDETIA